jgi:hypothetical protein
VLDLTSGYVQRALDKLPRQGSRKPWKMYQNYARDLLSVRLSRLNDGAMEFRRRVPQKARAGRLGSHSEAGKAAEWCYCLHLRILELSGQLLDEAQRLLEGQPGHIRSANPR